LSGKGERPDPAGKIERNLVTLLAAGRLLKTFPDLLDTSSDEPSSETRMRGGRLTLTQPAKFCAELQSMAWFTTQRLAAPSKRHLLRRLLGYAARRISRSHGAEKRRAHRVCLSAPVFLYGSVKGRPFFECSETVDVCAKGALVGTNAPLLPEQCILLTNMQTQQDLKCRVVRIDNHRKSVALEFLESCPHFWRIEFAPPSIPS
jgi:hypothetical protein